MNVLAKIVTVLILSVACSQLEAQDTHNITVTVKGIDSNEGQIFLALYDNESDFLDKSFKGTKSKIQNNQCVVTFENIPSGVYAVSIFHDANDNGKMDTNFMGIPKEDYGCSNDASGFMGPPKWSDAKFELKDNTSITINL
jgi:uncharacterized protein (DUF2141 family)